MSSVGGIACVETALKILDPIRTHFNFSITSSKTWLFCKKIRVVIDLIGQQIGSADSICANMDEGYGRISRTEYIRFLDIARGSARETLGRYKRLKHWLPQETINSRVQLTDSIIARLTTTIKTLKANNCT